MQSNFVRRGKGRAQGVPDVAPPERPPKDPVNIPIETPVLAPAASKGTVVGSRRSLLPILKSTWSLSGPVRKTCDLLTHTVRTS